MGNEDHEKRDSSVVYLLFEGGKKTDFAYYTHPYRRGNTLLIPLLPFKDKGYISRPFQQ